MAIFQALVRHLEKEAISATPNTPHTKSHNWGNDLLYLVLELVPWDRQGWEPSSYDSRMAGSTGELKMTETEVTSGNIEGEAFCSGRGELEATDLVSSPFFPDEGTEAPWCYDTPSDGSLSPWKGRSEPRPLSAGLLLFGEVPPLDVWVPQSFFVATKVRKPHEKPLLLTAIFQLKFPSFSV